MAQGFFFRFLFIFNYLQFNYFSFLDVLRLGIHHFWWKQYFSRTPGSYRYNFGTCGNRISTMFWFATIPSLEASFLIFLTLGLIKQSNTHPSQHTYTFNEYKKESKIKKKQRRLKTRSLQNNVVHFIYTPNIQNKFSSKQHLCVQGPLQECLRARRFRATLLLHTTCVRSWCNWRASSVAAKQNQKKQCATLVFWEQLELDKSNLTVCACQVDLSPSPPASLRINWQSDSLSNQVVKSTCKVKTLKSHAQVWRTPPRGGGMGHGDGQKKRSKSITFWFFCPIFWNDVLEITLILQCSPQRPQRTQPWIRVQSHRKVRRGQTGVWVASSHDPLFRGSDRGFVCRKFLWAYSFWGQWRVSRGEYTSRYGRDQHVTVGCIAYESRIYITHAWNLPKVEQSKF